MSDPEKQIAEIESPPAGLQDLGLTHISSAFSHELPPQAAQVLSDTDHAPADVYDRFTRQKKRGMVAILCLLAFLAPLSSTTVLAAVPNVAADFGTSGTIINVSNALYMLMCGLGPCFVGPLSEVRHNRQLMDRD